MTRSRRDSHDDPYGLGLDGPNVEGLAFLNPYRSLGELNETELMKLQRHPFEVAASVINTYAKEGVEALLAIPGEVERLKWVGVYPQRQGGDAFMMRVKVPGGVLTADQAREIGLAAEAFGRRPKIIRSLEIVTAISLPDKQSSCTGSTWPTFLEFGSGSHEWA